LKFRNARAPLVAHLYRLYHRRIIVADAGTVHARRDDPFLQTLTRAGFVALAQLFNTPAEGALAVARAFASLVQWADNLCRL
jgi:hypothetical protein